MIEEKNYSAFTDCASETVVIRVPYSFCVDLIMAAPDTEERRIIIKKLKRTGGGRLRRMLEEREGQTE